MGKREQNTLEPQEKEEIEFPFASAPAFIGHGRFFYLNNSFDKKQYIFIINKDITSFIQILSGEKMRIEICGIEPERAIQITKALSKRLSELQSCGFFKEKPTVVYRPEKNKKDPGLRYIGKKNEVETLIKNIGKLEEEVIYDFSEKYKLTYPVSAH